MRMEVCDNGHDPICFVAQVSYGQTVKECPCCELQATIKDLEKEISAQGDKIDALEDDLAKARS